MNEKVGLVLSGGGAKGAYQVGVIKALAELEIRVDVLSGASIGALNGAIVASAPTLADAAVRLERVWRQLAEAPPLKANVPGYVQFLLAAGLTFSGSGKLLTLLALARAHMPIRRIGKLPTPLDALDVGMMSDGPLREIMDEYMDMEALEKGIPFHVSVYRSSGAFNDIIAVIAAELGLSDTEQSEYLHLQSLAEDERKNVLLASAALPLLFAPQRFNDTLYSDGGQGGWKTVQGNTPITPLLESGCRTVIVTHLSDGSLWSRQGFPDATVLEIRPQQTVARGKGIGGGTKDLLGFDPSRIPSWMEQGYVDTMACVGRVRAPVEALAALGDARRVLSESLSRDEHADELMAASIARLV